MKFKTLSSKPKAVSNRAIPRKGIKMKTIIRQWDNASNCFVCFDEWHDNGENYGLKKLKSYVENISNVQYMDKLRNQDDYEKPVFGKSHPLVVSRTPNEIYRELMKTLGIPKTKSEYLSDLKKQLKGDL